MASTGLPLDAWFKYTGTQVGRDKIYRFWQYFARFLATRSTGETAQKWQKLSGALGTARKHLKGRIWTHDSSHKTGATDPSGGALVSYVTVFRIAKPLENLNNILKASSIKDDTTRYLTIGKTAFLGLWLLQDMMQWFDSVGFYKVKDIKSLNTNTLRAWFIGLIFSVTLDLYKLRQNQAKQRKLQPLLTASGAATNQEASRKEMATLVAERRTILIELLNDTLDLFLPGSGLEYVKVEPGKVGLIGAATSLIGVYQTWPK